ncbi:MAG: virulence factor family protein [Deltaproteobacteria bacterium]|nr:virulence factor family protein [Deltaproteobacteria bacterium]
MRSPSTILAIGCVAGVLVGLALLGPAAGDARAGEEKFTFGRFGTVTVYRPSERPAQVVLFVSGDGGWNLGVVDMARELAGLDALVVGIDITHYLRELAKGPEKCSYPASDFEDLSQFVQKKMALPSYSPPVLVGYSSGATLVYAVLVQSPPNTFRGALSLGFCPDLPLTKPLCRGSGLEWAPGPKGKGVVFQPASHLSAPWVAFQGTIDQVCDPAATEAYVQRVKGGEIVVLPHVGHGFSVPRNWMPQFRDAFRRLVARPQETRVADAADVRGLPLVEVPASGPETDTLAVIVSGDGGWAGIDRSLGEALAGRGVPVVGLNSLQYFWTARTPETAAADLGRLLRHYLAAWGKKRALLVGYSLGAEVLPFLVTRLPAELRGAVRSVALLGPSTTADFEFHVGYWLGGGPSAASLPVLPEVQKLKGLRVLCVYGDEEKDSVCPRLPAGLADVQVLPGAHHFGGNYTAIADRILREAL